MRSPKVDFVLDLPGQRRWAIEIKRSLAPALGKGFHLACSDLRPERRYLVHAGEGRYPLGHGVEAIGLRDLAAALVG